MSLSKQHLSDLEKVLTDLVSLVAAGYTPAGVIAAISTISDVIKTYKDFESDGTTPMPLTSNDVSMSSTSFKVTP